MSIRKDKTSRDQWRRRLRENRAELLECGIPLVVLESERNWAYFLGHGYFAPDGRTSIIDVDEMPRAQAERLLKFLEADQDSRQDAGSLVLIRLRHLLRGEHQ